MRKRLFQLRRWGVAVLAGVTVLGAVSSIGVTAASATLAGTAVAPITTPATIIAGATSAASVPNFVLTLPSGAATNDTLHIDVNPNGGVCTAGSTGSNITVGGITPGVITATASGGGVGPSFTIATGSQSGCAATNEIQLTELTPATPAATSTLTLSGLTYLASEGSKLGAVAVAGTFGGSSAGTIAFPSNATVTATTIAADNPAANLAGGTTNGAISNITLTEPQAGTLPSASYVCLTLSDPGATFSSSPAPVVSATAGVGAAVLSSTVPTVTGGSISFKLTSQSTTIASAVTLSNLHVNVPTPPFAGTTTVSTSLNSAANCAVGTFLSAFATNPPKPTVYSSITSSQTLYGQTADATTATEFEQTFGATPGTCTEGGLTVVMATDFDPYDAMTAAYLAGELGTGVLITPILSLGSDASTALRIMGVSTVYVVGGPLAIVPAVITAIKATPVYNCGGASPVSSGATITVVGPIFGQTADDTAQAIASFYPATAVGTLTTVGSAYNSTGGAYNDTFAAYPTSNGSTTGPTTNFATAFVVSDTDAADAATIGGISYSRHFPILLTPAATLGTQATASLTSLKIGQAIVMGGSLAVTQGVVGSIQALGAPVLRIAGTDYTDTAVQVTKFETGSATSNLGLGWSPGTAVTPSNPLATPTIMVARGDNVSDAEGAAALSGINQEPILLTLNPSSLGSFITAELNQAGNGASTPPGLNGVVITKLVVLGGPSAVPPAEVTAMVNAIAAG